MNICFSLLAALSLLALSACGDPEAEGSAAGYDSDDDQKANTCRADCSSAHSTCFNACNAEDEPGVCRTQCGNEQLVCQKDCEGRYPAETDNRCRTDCSSAHSTCFNECNSQDEPQACQKQCGTMQVACQKDCASRYP